MNSDCCSYQNCQKDAEFIYQYNGQPPANFCKRHLTMHCFSNTGGEHNIRAIPPKVSEEKARVIEKFFSISEKEVKLTIDSAIKTTLEIINQLKAELSSIIERSSEIKAVNKSLYKKLVDYALGQRKLDLSSNLQQIFKVPDIENYLSKNTIFHYYSINTMVSQFEVKWKSKLNAEPDSPARSNPEETTSKEIPAKYESLKIEYWKQINRIQFMESNYMNEIKKNGETIKENEKIIEELQKEKVELERSVEEIFEANIEINRKKDEEFKSELAIIKDQLEDLINRKNLHGDLMTKIERVFNKALSHQAIENKNLKQKFEDNKEKKKDADFEMRAKRAQEMINGNNIPMKRHKPDEEEQKYRKIPKISEKSKFRADDTLVINDFPDMIPKKHQKK